MIAFSFRNLVRKSALVHKRRPHALIRATIAIFNVQRTLAAIFIPGARCCDSLTNTTAKNSFSSFLENKFSPRQKLHEKCIPPALFLRAKWVAYFPTYAISLVHLQEEYMRRLILITRAPSCILVEKLKVSRGEKKDGEDGEKNQVAKVKRAGWFLSKQIFSPTNWITRSWTLKNCLHSTDDYFRMQLFVSSSFIYFAHLANFPILSQHLPELLSHFAPYTCVKIGNNDEALNFSHDIRN